MVEKRKHQRFSATAFLNMPIELNALPPFFSHSVKGKLIDLSAGGMAILINEVIPMGTKLDLKVRFPDHSYLESIILVKRVVPRSRKFLIGIEFLTVPGFMEKKIEKMSADYIDCESRINEGSTEICRVDCAFFTMCKKKERVDPVVDLDKMLEITFEQLTAKDKPIAVENLS